MKVWFYTAYLRQDAPILVRLLKSLQRRFRAKIIAYGQKSKNWWASEKWHTLNLKCLCKNNDFLQCQDVRKYFSVLGRLLTIKRLIFINMWYDKTKTYNIIIKVYVKGTTKVEILRARNNFLKLHGQTNPSLVII